METPMVGDGEGNRVGKDNLVGVAVKTLLGVMVAPIGVLVDLMAVWLFACPQPANSRDIDMKIANNLFMACSLHKFFHRTSFVPAPGKE